MTLEFQREIKCSQKYSNNQKQFTLLKTLYQKITSFKTKLQVKPNLDDVKAIKQTIVSRFAAQGEEKEKEDTVSVTTNRFYAKYPK
jgi:hypothetical protein